MEVAHLTYVLETRNSFSLPAYKGATFRGTFGHHLKHTICIMRHRNCEACEVRAQCPFPYIFASRNGNNQEVLRPFVIKPPLTRKQFFLAKENLFLNQVLIGKAIDYLPYFVYTFLRMGERGIGRDRGRYQLKALYAVDAEGQKHAIYDPEKGTLESQFPRIDLDKIKSKLIPQVTIQFLTPTHIKTNGKMIRETTFPVLLKAILRRYHRLRYVHGDGQREEFAIDWDLAETIEVVHQELQGEFFRRYSNRQKQSVPVEGIMGKVIFRGNLSPFYPWLKIGEYLHVGKGATFGLGWYRVLE